MPVELPGSFLIFAMLAFIRWRWLRVALAATAAIHNVGTAFYGYFCRLSRRLPDRRAAGRRRSPRQPSPRARRCDLRRLDLISLPRSVCSICLQAATFGGSQADYMLAMNLIAVLVVLGVVLTGPARRRPAHPVSQFLGRISFGLYLTHFDGDLLVLGRSLSRDDRSPGLTAGWSRWSAGCRCRSPWRWATASPWSSRRGCCRTSSDR